MSGVGSSVLSRCATRRRGVRPSTRFNSAQGSRSPGGDRRRQSRENDSSPKRENWKCLACSHFVVSEEENGATVCVAHSIPAWEAALSGVGLELTSLRRLRRPNLHITRSPEPVTLAAFSAVIVAPPEAPAATAYLSSGRRRVSFPEVSTYAKMRHSHPPKKHRARPRNPS